MGAYGVFLQHSLTTIGGFPRIIVGYSSLVKRTFVISMSSINNWSFVPLPAVHWSSSALQGNYITLHCLIGHGPARNTQRRNWLATQNNSINLIDSCMWESNTLREPMYIFIFVFMRTNG